MAVVAPSAEEHTEERCGAPGEYRVSDRTHSSSGGKGNADPHGGTAAGSEERRSEVTSLHADVTGCKEAIVIAPASLVGRSAARDRFAPRNGGCSRGHRATERFAAGIGRNARGIAGPKALAVGRSARERAAGQRARIAFASGRGRRQCANRHRGRLAARHRSAPNPWPRWSKSCPRGCKSCCGEPVRRSSARSL